jgi:hypothetical protein
MDPEIGGTQIFYGTPLPQWVGVGKEKKFIKGDKLFGRN